VSPHTGIACPDTVFVRGLTVNTTVSASRCGAASRRRGRAQDRVRRHPAP